jgi:hypothetical protein
LEVVDASKPLRNTESFRYKNYMNWHQKWHLFTIYMINVNMVFK